MKIAATFTALLCSAAALGAQQTPPPPVPPTPPVRVSRPRVVPIAPLAPLPAQAPDLDMWRSLNIQAPLPDLESLDLNLQNLDFDDQFTLRNSLEASRAAMANIDMGGLVQRSLDASRAAMANIDMNDVRRAAEDAQYAAQSATWAFSGSEGSFARAPRPAWAHDDPADSLYRLARQTFNDGDWRRSAQYFHQIVTQYPKSAYAADCAYYEAFSRYRIGTTDELHNALALLSPPNTLASQSSRQSDVAALAARIRGALAARGDQQAAAQIAKDAQAPSGCDREEMNVKAAALNALAQMDPASATPLLQQVLQRTDTCSAPLKRSALLMLLQRGDSLSNKTLIQVALDEHQDLDVRNMAVSYLGRSSDPAALTTLQSLLTTSNNDQLQRAALEGLAQSDSPKAKTAVRALIQNSSASESLRSEAIGSLAYGDKPSADDAAFLRTAYATMPSERLKQTVLRVLARMGGAQNQKFLMDIAANPSESSEVRGMAISMAGRDTTIAVSEWSRLYDASESRSLRTRIIEVLANQGSAPATDKLMDIVRTSTDPYTRRMALSALSQRKDDPRVKKFLVDLVGG